MNRHATWFLAAMTAVACANGSGGSAGSTSANDAALQDALGGTGVSFVQPDAGEADAQVSAVADQQSAFQDVTGPEPDAEELPDVAAIDAEEVADSAPAEVTIVADAVDIADAKDSGAPIEAGVNDVQPPKDAEKPDVGSAKDTADSASIPDIFVADAGEPDSGPPDVPPVVDAVAPDVSEMPDVQAPDIAEVFPVETVEDAGSPPDVAAGTDAQSPPDVPAPDAVGTDAVGTDAEQEVVEAPSECSALPTGALTLCAAEMANQTTAKGAFAVSYPDGTKRYVCADGWNAVQGYTLGNSGAWVAKPEDCCGAGGPSTPFAPPPLTAYGYLGSTHAPEQIHPEELMETTAGAVRTNPFTVVVTDATGGEKLKAAYADWKTWAGSTTPHPGPDGTGGYFLHKSLKLIYVLLQDKDNKIVILVGPNLYLTYDGNHAGHPSLGVCNPTGGTPVALLGGEIVGTTLNNDSGRFGHNPGVTKEALTNAAKIFNARGIAIDSVDFLPP